MTLNENKKKTIVRTGGTLAIVTSVALNLITVLDWLGISPKESAARNQQTVVAVQEAEYAPLSMDYGFTYQDDAIQEVSIVSPGTYSEYVMEVPEQEEAPIEYYGIPEEYPAEYYGISADEDAPVILNAVQLTDMEFCDASDVNGGFALRNSGMDITGKTYSPVLLTDTPVLLTTEHEYLRYNQYVLDGQCHTFAGTVFLTAEYASTYGYVYFEVYGDGALLDCYAFTDGCLPVNFEVDVTGVDVLEIRAVTSTDVSPVIGLANAFFAYY